MLGITKTILKHNQNTLQQERKKAIELLSKIETVLRVESEQQSQSQQQPQPQQIQQQQPQPQQQKSRQPTQSFTSTSQNITLNKSISEKTIQNKSGFEISNNLPFQQRTQLSQSSTQSNKVIDRYQNEMRDSEIVDGFTPKKSSNSFPISESNRVKLPFPVVNDTNSTKNVNSLSSSSSTNISSLSAPVAVTKQPNIPIFGSINTTNSTTRSGNNVPFSNQPSLEDIEIELINDNDVDDNENDDGDGENENYENFEEDNDQIIQEDNEEEEDEEEEDAYEQEILQQLQSQKQEQLQLQLQQENKVVKNQENIKAKEIETPQNKLAAAQVQVQIPTPTTTPATTTQHPSAVRLSITSKIWGMGGNDNEVSDSEWDD